tara:strand:+ start:457 stop:909 length:453 start_codon:yes stop_codon:yes gene_type:complete
MSRLNQRHSSAYSSRWATAALAYILINTVCTGAARQASDVELYTCPDDNQSEAVIVGMALCTAEPTEALMMRAEPDNLQVRSGALVSNIDANGVAANAGLSAGDVIYRVGSVDVENASAALERLSAIGSTADTVVNFLRGGRPYRVKLRR